MNLPGAITVTSKGTITYTYDAAGNKLEKITVDNTVSPAKTTVITYVGGFVYEASSPVGGGQVGADVLQFLPMEEGRIRPLRDANNNITSFTYDYFIKDHLGNVRMVLTEEQKTDAYPAATMETANISSESTYYSNLTVTQYAKPSWFSDPVYSSSAQVARVRNASGSQKIGPSILLKVMAGDSYNIRAASGWSSGSSTANSQSEVLTDLLLALSGGLSATSGGKVTGTQLQDPSSGLSTGISNFLNTQTNSGAPKAYISWILFDEQFKYYAGSFDQVKTNGSTYIHQFNGLSVPKNGYLYIYTSNESQNIDVFFDNLQVTHIRGPLIEETHYYPFGLTMAGISSNAANTLQNKKGYNGNELQSKEFSDGSGLEMYDFNARFYDPQLGRFMQVDPMSEEGDQESWGPFGFGYDNPIRYNDPDGKCPCLIPFLIPALKAATAAVVAYVVVDANKENIQQLADNISDRVNSNKSDQTGSYTNTHESGKKYHGKGSEQRAQQSAKEKEKTYNDPAKNTDWKPAKNDKEAFKDEAKRIRKDGGVENPNNYNKRNSPGEKELKKQDGKGTSKGSSGSPPSIVTTTVVTIIKIWSWFN